MKTEYGDYLKTSVKRLKELASPEAKITFTCNRGSNIGKVWVEYTSGNLPDKVQAIKQTRQAFETVRKEEIANYLAGK